MRDAFPNRKLRSVEPMRSTATASPRSASLCHSATKPWARRVGALSALLFAVAAQAGDWEWGGTQFGIDFSWRSDKPCADETSELRVKVENRRGEGVKVAFRVWNAAFDRSFSLQVPAGAVDTSAVVRPEASTCYPAIDNVWIESWEAAPPMAEAEAEDTRRKKAGDEEVLVGLKP